MCLGVVKKSTSKRAVITFLVVVLVACSIAGNNLSITKASFSDVETASNNTLQAWNASLWTQTSQADFDAGVLNDVDATSSPGDVTLDTVISEPTTSTGAEQAWYYVAWIRRAPVTITNTGSAQTDYQVRVDVTYDADMQPDFDDIRFVDSDDATPLAYCSESVINSSSAIFWVNIPSIPVGSKIIYMYYGNATVGNACDGDATFPFYDDFGGTSLSASKWQSTGDITVAGGEVHINCTADGQGIAVVIPDYYFGLGYSVEYRERFGETDVAHLIQGPYEYYDAQHHATALSALADGTGYARTANDSVITETLLGYYDTLYHRYQITRISGEASYYYDGFLLATHNTNVPPDDLRLQFTGDNTADIYLDWVFVRKYAATEPIASVGAEDGWGRRAPVTISNPLAGLTGYQVSVDITYDADMQPDFDDIRFFDSDGITPLGHWRESYIASASAVFWVRVPSVPSGNKIIYMYYGNSAASSASNGDATFEFYDDFEDGDISDWSQYSSGTVQIANDSGNFVLLKTANDDPNGGYSLFNYGALSDFEVTLRTKRINESGGSQNRYGIEDGSFNGYGPRMYDFNTLPASFSIERRTGGSSSNLVVKGTSAYQWNTWMTVVFRKYGTRLEFELYNSSGILVESISTNSSTYTSFDRFVVHGGWEYYTDDIRVRKYAAQATYVASGTLASQVLDTGAEGTTWDGLFWDETGTSEDWYDNNWQYRRGISLSPATSMNNHQVLVTLTTAEMGNPYSNINADGSDIRFTGADKLTLQDYWIESWDSTGTSRIWVEVAVPGTSVIYMYYGNAAAGSASDGTSTFDFFDDFSGDLSQWTIDPENTDAVYIDVSQGNSAPALRHDPDSSQTKNGYFDTRLITSSYAMVDGIIEYDVFLAGAPRIIHQLGFRVNSLGFTNGYCWRMQNLTADGGWLRFINGSWTKIGTNWGPTSGGVWHSVKMEVTDANFTAYVDGGGAISVTDSNKQTEDYLVSHVHGVGLTASSYVLVDNVRVRKYAPAEPAASVGTVESKPGQLINIIFEVRSSDTAFNAGDATPFWNIVGGTSPVVSGLPSGRYLQWRAVLSTTDTANTPTLHEVRVYYY
jgi:hypothetical protein